MENDNLTGILSLSLLKKCLLYIRIYEIKLLKVTNNNAVYV